MDAEIFDCLFDEGESVLPYADLSKAERPNRKMQKVNVDETWIQHEAAAAYDALQADPERGISAKEVRARLVAEHTKNNGQDFESNTS